jgi:hypothetical protein
LSRGENGVAWEGIGVRAVERSDGTVVRAENVDEVQELRKCDGLAAVGAMRIKDQGGLGGPVEVTVGEGVAGEGDEESDERIVRWAKIDQVVTLDEDAGEG